MWGVRTLSRMEGSNTNVKHAISHLQTPPLALPLASPPARLPIAPLFPCLLRLRIRFLRHWPWYLLPIASTPKPVVQLLIRNLYTQLPPTPRHHLPYRPKPPLQYRLRHPPLPRPYFWPHSLICASIPRLIPLYPPLRTCATLTPSFTRFNRSPRRNNHNTCYPLTISAYLSRL